MNTRPSIGGMTSKGTSRRTVRVPDPLWPRLVAKCEAEGTTASEVLRQAMVDYLEEGQDDE